ncbi:hypothetical protein [Natrarchaeobius chitinivorans]|uniref:Uncharacterized protein n=1 Tax=Natrarchaeobius chitinivorans TaxID=1679083 RepID=A0A3N6MIB7_NATCH|nr:hypothetical protein [Natrarchaeobius chitinivorans]RQG95381.1 hypothetical protein EA473_07900 [Natrarchaeobius chitinivorans]
MRLTPSWFSPSSNESGEERTKDADPSSSVTIYYDSTATPESSVGVDVEATATNFVPESDEALLAAIEEIPAPVTIDSIVDRLLDQHQQPIETWAAVHEHLYENRLPALDAADVVDFDPDRGTVELPDPEARNGGQLSVSLLGFCLFSFVVVLLFAWMTSVLTALTFTFIVMTLVAWFVPISGFV